jgi:Tfp pilus assembly protein PilF
MAVVLTLAASVYSNSCAGVFVFDDETAIVSNRSIRSLWPLTAAMSAPRDTTLAGRPVPSLSFALNYAAAPPGVRDAFSDSLDGAEAARFRANVWGYHAANLLIHLLTALVLFGVCRRTFSAGPMPQWLAGQAEALAFFTTAIWAVHPLTTAAVTYIVQRVESMMGLLYLVTLYGAIRSLSSPGLRWPAVSAGACALGMATKESMVTAPVMVACWDLLFVAGPWRSILARRWGLYAALCSSWLVLAWIMSSAPRSASVGFGLQGVTAWDYLVTQSGVIAHYLRLAFVPWPLTLDYDWRIVASSREVVREAAVVISLLVVTAWGLVRRRAWAFAGAWVFVILAPTSSFVPIVTEVAAEHRMYLPLAGIIGAVCAGCWRAVTASPDRYRRIARKSAFAAGLAVLLLFGTLTYARNEDYRDAETIYRTSIAAQPSNARAMNNLATLLLQRGEAVEAERYLRLAVASRPEYPEAHANLGVAMAMRGHPADAIPFFERAVLLNPDYAAAWRNYGEALASLARFREALAAYRKALAAHPDDPRLLGTMAWILSTAPDAGVRNGGEALDLARRASSIQQDRDARALDILAAALAERGEFNNAVSTAERALSIARSEGRTALAEDISYRLSRYRAGSPYRESPVSEGGR